MKKVGLLLLALVLALGALGVGYAKWTDTVTINATVNTGTVILGIVDNGTSDDGVLDVAPLPLIEVAHLGSDPQCGPGTNTEFKNVASTVSTNGAAKTGCTLAYQSVTETFTNVYPYYSPTLYLTLKNCGTVPVKISNLAAYYHAPATNPVDLVPWMFFSITGLDEDGIPFGPITGDITAIVPALSGLQIRGGGTIQVNMNICFEEWNSTNHIDANLLPQNSNATYEIVITAAQWNEVP